MNPRAQSVGSPVSPRRRGTLLLGSRTMTVPACWLDRQYRALLVAGVEKKYRRGEGAK